MHDLILNFDKNVSVTVTSSVGCTSPKGTIVNYDDFRQAAPDLMAMINHTVISAEGYEGGKLCLVFDGDKKLVLYDDSKDYESYTIKHGNELIVV